MGDHTQERQFLASHQIDGVANAVIALARELWVVADRLTVLEAVLDQKGIDASAAIEAFEPDEALQARLDERRDALVAMIADKFSGNR